MTLTLSSIKIYAAELTNEEIKDLIIYCENLLNDEPET